MKITIITVVYNNVQTVESAVKSVFSQDYPDIEYIVIDGVSTDGTLDVLGKYRDKTSRFISEPDNGIYDAMNKGIKLATGDYVGFLNADDFYASSKVISLIADTLQKQNCGCCWGDVEYVSRNNIGKTIRIWKSSPYKGGLFEKGWQPPHPGLFVKKEIFDKYGLFDASLTISADYELMLRLLKKYRISSVYIPEVLVKMRAGGISNKSIFHIYKANLECFSAWKKNGLRINPLIILRKPLAKVRQFI